MPPADNAKHNFDAMKKSSAEELENINLALEGSVSNHKMLQDDMKNIEAEEAKISVELKCKRPAVEIAKENLDRKKAQLSDSKEILRTAEDKLKKARDSQETAMKVTLGFSVIPLLGLLAVPITVIVAKTVLEDNIKEASYHTKSAREEVDSSERALKEVISSEENVKKELNQLYRRKTCTKLKLENLTESIKQLKQEQENIIEVNEKIKNCYNALCRFHGTFKVLWSETRSGYSLSLLKDATQPVVESVRTLLQSSSVNALCDGSTLADLNYHYEQIEQVTSIAIRNEPEDDDLLDLI